MPAGEAPSGCESGATITPWPVLENGVTLIRGKGLGLEIALEGGEVDAALDELQARLAERDGFYRGTTARVVYRQADPTPVQRERLAALLSAAGIAMSALERRVEPELERRRALRTPARPTLSEQAQSLVADFAGARADIAARRRNGQSSVRRIAPRAAAAVPAPPPPTLQAVANAPQTLYHVGTLRGGQALYSLGAIVVVGDVNPGAELVAAGDIVVFGRLGGVAHAGAQGDEAARVYALDLDATQVRIAAFIASDDAPRPAGGAEVALVRDGRIAVVPLGAAEARGAVPS